jgi:FlgD Ig-like domain
MKTIMLAYCLVLSAMPAFGQLRQVWESPATNGRKGTAWGFNGERYFYLQDRISQTLQFYDQETFVLKYTLQNVEADIFPALTPDLNGNGVAEVLIENFTKGSLKLLDLGTQKVLSQWEHPDTSYNWLSFTVANNVFELLIEKTSKSTGFSALVYYTNTIGTYVDGNPVSVATADFSLAPNYPNPFNPGTTIHYALNKAGQIRLGIYNLQGQLIRTLAEGNAQPGAYTMVWDGSDARGNPVSSGTYYYQLQLNDAVVTHKMIKIK